MFTTNHQVRNYSGSLYSSLQEVQQEVLLVVVSSDDEEVMDWKRPLDKADRGTKKKPRHDSQS